MAFLNSPVGLVVTMAIVKVFLYASIREAAGYSKIEVQAADLQSLLDSLKAKSSPNLAKLLPERGDNSERIVVLLNGVNVGRKDPEAVKLADGDEVSLFPPVSGG